MTLHEELNWARKVAGLPVALEATKDFRHPGSKSDPIEDFVSELAEEIVSIAAKKLDKFGKITADAKSAENAMTMGTAFANAMYKYLEKSTK